VEKVKEFFNNRILVIKLVLILVGALLLLRLIDLQIINGAEYREQSEKKMVRETVVEAPRGEIYDRNGVVLATNKLAYDVVIYKVGLDNETLNKTLIKVINILEKNSDEVYVTFPMDSLKEGFYTDSQRENICEIYGIETSLTDREILNHIYEKYELNNMKFNESEKFKVARLRYELATNVFSLFSSVTIAKDVSYATMAIIEESKDALPGIEINVNSKRYYPYGTLASHLIGYVSSISSEEYQELKNEGYLYNSNIGKMGIETTMERYLKGDNGIKRTEVDAEGEIAAEYVYKEAGSGNNVTLTIDYRLQTIAETNLKKVINNIATGAPRLC